MNVYAVRRRSYYGDRDDIDSFHSACYHGFFLGGRYYRNIKASDFLALPALELVGENVAFCDCRPLNIQPLQDVTWFDCDFKVGDFSHWEIDGFYDDGVSVKEYLAARSLPSDRICWVARLPELAAVDDGPSVTFTFNLEPEEEMETRLRVPLGALNDSLAFRCQDVIFLGEAVYGALQPVLLTPFFVTKSVEIR